MSKKAAALFSAALALAIVAPVKESWRGKEGDSFPFSWYPMFSRSRPDPERSLYVIGRDADGTRHIVTSQYYARGTMNQARRQLQRLTSNGDRAQDLCRRIATRIAEQTEGELAKVVDVRIVQGWFDVRKYFAERDSKPLREQTVVACSVRRRPRAGGGSAAVPDFPDAADEPEAEPRDEPATP